jgi:hypothetical protein
VTARCSLRPWQDGCTGGRQLPGGVDNASATLYAKMRDAVARATARTGRPIFLNIKQDIVPGGFGAACALANSFRVADDIKPCQGETGLITDIASQALRYAGPGCFLDLDSLEVGGHFFPNLSSSATVIYLVCVLGRWVSITAALTTRIQAAAASSAWLNGRPSSHCGPSSRRSWSWGTTCPGWRHPRESCC